MDVTQNNKLIAEFMGASCMGNKLIKYPDRVPGWFYKQNHIDLLGDLEYHLSWDWLMPVVETIETMNEPLQGIKCYVDIMRDYCIVSYENFPKDITVKIPTNTHGKIQSVWYCIVEFIKWHNAQK